ncbi:huntingtin-interacting protein 1 isoform X2 [Plodia interpunctella]|uniref:huntingtin-interacting protein 1 isoform X2 n=1 Tax=Plodia interpunctella TaxID=58824 RepID=UPI002367A3B3|nr:huntingtin-interacting protein 1 isoform X2 [Plodia interpunctella]XP_053609900.1 huntingtin-interacting protein 1 isoform X2 [Plodia interpunctella]XP_053609901.1 huntingtin-interacting protein 1 isoform X2 [Plodia interpunctella]XP_053609902.1 huntingtin-interacting protein 1 isoform X2 [Plodia interpunctella]
MNPNNKRFYQQTLAIQKAINSVETPVKEKHVRSAIIGTFREQSAVTYWMVAIRLPLQENRIVAWKFCHVTHKLLREGHPACLDDSQRHISMIENLARLWVHLREGYGKLVNLYCNLLVCKLKFHARNPRFPGNMQLTADELDAIAENDVNNYFQLCVELFDYMDEILTLQAAVFDSLGNARANSMTASGQCRLAALIPCAQDSSHIYDCNVRLLFRLHAALPADTLLGHRERFRQQFKKLSSFYKHASSLQYYRNLLTLPVLPSNPPNFLQQSDFGTYVAPVVSIPEPAPDEVDAVGSLIDTSDTISQATTPDQLDTFEARATPSPQPDPIVERDKLIEHLQNELKRIRSERTQMVQERNTMLGSMREHCTQLETQLRSVKTELEEERQKAEVLSAQTPEMQQKLTETEQKAKVTDEKFQKLKGAYTQLREEHITLIRQKAEVDKMAASLRAATAQHESAKLALQQQLNDRQKDVELLQQSASSSEEIEAYKTEISNLRSEIEQSRHKEVELENLKASIEALEIEHKTATAEQSEKLILVTNELKETKDNLEAITKEKEEREGELIKVKEELVGLREKSGNEYKKVVEEKEAVLKEVADLTQRYQQEKEEQMACMNKLHEELENLQQKLISTDSDFVVKYDKVNEELKSQKREFEDTLDTKENEIKEALQNLEILESELESNKELYENSLKEKTETITNLEEKVAQLTDVVEDYKTKLEETIKNNHTAYDSIQTKLNDEIVEKQNEISELRKLLEENDSRFVKINSNLEEKQSEVLELRKLLEENTELGNEHKSKSEYLLKTISDLEGKLASQSQEIENLISQLKETTSLEETRKLEFEKAEKEYNYEITILKNKIENIVECKDELINNLKGMIETKDEQVITLNVEVKKLTEDVEKLQDELNETQAELEIGKNELFSLEEEHAMFVRRNDENIALKNQELRNLDEEVKKLSQEKSELLLAKDKIISDFASQQSVYESKLKEFEEKHGHLLTEQNDAQREQDAVIDNLNKEIEALKGECQQIKMDKDGDIQSMEKKIEARESDFTQQINEKDNIISNLNDNLVQLKAELESIVNTKLKEKEDIEVMLSEKDKNSQLMEARLEHTESKRMSIECELQDLLQHNSVLEADVSILKKQLEDAQRQLELQRANIVKCASAAAVEVTDEALASLERADAHESNSAAAAAAAQALGDLATLAQVKGSEESVARNAVATAHNAARLSAYVTDVCNVSTDMELSDKLTDECRTMLTSTKRCLESLTGGVVEAPSCEAARELLSAVAALAARAHAAASGARSVDDELADMDRAIEQAAEQIESMLAASRAGDSGVKLEVNGKILDACTTLMAAVKVLVQDSRKLQSELGDPHTRQKMYRHNPQWSEGLISAAKAVVFAAKLLVTSADEAVGAAGRVEGVSAAAHEVAGSTAQLVAASRARAPHASPALARLTQASRSVAAATGALVAAVRAGSALVHDQEALDTSALTLTATRRLEMESKVRALELESALDAERARLAALRKRHYHLAQLEENGGIANGKE